MTRFKRPVRVLSVTAYNDDLSLHAWVGPVGVHLFWPDVWKSRPGFCLRWRQPIS